jgi:thioredoxin-like negative regulator of GroEL
MHPSDPELQLQLAGLLLTDGRTEEAAAAYHELLTRNADSRTWHRAGTSLAQAGEYKLARDFLERAADIPAARLDLAIALFFTGGPREALSAIERVPETERGGDYWLMKARILEAAGQDAEVEKILGEHWRGSILRPDVAMEAALLLVRHNRASQALTLLDHAARAHPSNPDLLLERAVVMALSKDTTGAEQILKQIESRWPEWNRVYLVHGLLLETMSDTATARQKLEMAAALGSTDAMVRCGLTRLAGQTSPSRDCDCAGGLRDLLYPPCR